MVERADINSVLMQIRAQRTQMMQAERTQQQRVGRVDDMAPQGLNRTEKPSEVSSFSDMLKSAVDSVNNTQQTAGQLATAYEQGDPNVDITRVMVASQKATVSFQALTQVRNKVVQAYEDIMKMPI